MEQPPARNLSAAVRRLLQSTKVSLCTGGVSYALYISLLISKLFCTNHFLPYRWGKGGSGMK